MHRQIEFYETDTFVICFDETKEFVVDFGSISQTGTSLPTYQGSYEVNPDFVGKTLSTKHKILRDDVTVHPIEVQRVSNPTGGKTVYIGGIIDG